LRSSPLAWTLGGTLIALVGENAVFGDADIDGIAALVRALARETLLTKTRTPSRPRACVLDGCLHVEKFRPAPLTS
jgi:hypothetical protein